MVEFRRLVAVFLLGLLGLSSGAFADNAPLSALRADLMAVWNDPAPSQDPDALPDLPQMPAIAQLPDGSVLRADRQAEEPPEPRINSYPFFQQGTAASSSAAGSLFAIAPPMMEPMEDISAGDDDLEIAEDQP